MYIVHHFAHPETLNRARFWLNKFGFKPSRMEAHTDGTPRIALQATMSEAVEAELLFAALEASEPNNQPGFWGPGLGLHGRPAPTDEQEAAGHRSATVVGWHPPADDLLNDPMIRALHDAMSNR